MTPQEAATALAAAVETTPTLSTPQIGAQRCIRRPGSVWTACTCAPCRLDTNRKVKLWRCGRAPRPPRTAEARARLRMWLDAGWSTSAIAAATGMKRPAARQMVRLHQDVDRPMANSTVTAILNAPADPPNGRIPAVGATRRLRALAWMGWSLAELAERTQLPISVLSVIRQAKVQHTEARTTRAIAAVFDDLQNVRGPNARARNQALAEHWAPPAAWDEDTINDLHARPQGVLGSLPTAGSVPVDPHVLEQIEVLHRAGLNDGEIGVRLGRSRESVNKLRTRHDIRRSA